MGTTEYLIFAVGTLRPQDSTRPDVVDELQILCIHQTRGAVFVPATNIGPTLPPLFMNYGQTRKNQWRYEVANPKANFVVAPRSALAKPEDLVGFFKSQNQDLKINLGPLLKGKQ